jgi:uncharacterized protein
MVASRTRRARTAACGLALSGLLLAACSPAAQPGPPRQEAAILPVTMSYFEIPVTDLDRAMAFYEAVFGFDFERATIDGYEMALLPPAPGGQGASGALAKGDVYVPSKTGPILYFTVADMDAVMAGATAGGGAILYPKKDNGDLGFVGEIEDSEGNRIALIEPKD